MPSSTPGRLYLGLASEMAKFSGLVDQNQSIVMGRKVPRVPRGQTNHFSGKGVSSAHHPSV